MSPAATLTAAIPRSLLERLFDGLARPPAIVWAPALLVAAMLLAAPAYLAIRTLGAGPEAAELIFRTRTVWVVLRTVALMATVMVGCILIATPLAWLTVRADLPGRAFWRVVTMLPLALPSYIVGFAIAIGLGPRGTLQGWLEDGFRNRAHTQHLRFSGGCADANHHQLSLRIAARARRLVEPGRLPGRIGPRVGAKPLANLPRRYHPPCCGRRYWPAGLLVALYTLSDFRRRGRCCATKPSPGASLSSMGQP